MDKTALSNFATNTKLALAKHSPEILTGIGIAGMVTTVVLAVKATPRAMELIEDEREDRFYNNDDTPVTPIEVVKIAWKPYIPAAITGSVSVACLIGASSVNVRRNAALATAYSLSETALREYREKVVEVVGEKKEKTVREKVAEEKLKNNPVSKSNAVILGKGTTLCFDAISGRYFQSDYDTIKKAQNELNSRLLREMYISLNEFYDELELDHVSVGDDLGWSYHKDGLIEFDLNAQLADDGTPCLVVDYRVAPHYDYYKFA